MRPPERAVVAEGGMPWLPRSEVCSASVHLESTVLDKDVSEVPYP